MVSRPERLPDDQEGLRSVQEDVAAKLWVGGPGIIETVNLTAMTCTVQPVTQAIVLQQTGQYAPMTLPLLVDVPLKFQQGGGLALTFPVQAGDECWYQIADRAIDNWWKKGGVQPPAELRVHDLSDACAFVGINSQPNTFSVSSTSARLGLKTGTAYIEVTKAGAINIVGNVTINGNVLTTGTLLNNNVSVGSTHVHTGVQSGSSNSGPPET